MIGSYLDCLSPEEMYYQQEQNKGETQNTNLHVQLWCLVWADTEQVLTEELSSPGRTVER